MLNPISIPEENQSPRKSAFHFPRGEISEISRYLDAVLARMSPLDYEISYKDGLSKLKNQLGVDLPGSPLELGRDVLISDISDVVTIYFKLSQSKRARIQLGVVDTDMCRLFHVDNVSIRILCTYKGPGTEWLDDSNVEREGLGKGDNNKVVRDFDLINRASEFDLLILRGAKLFGEKEGAVHRSPPIEAIHERRILLKIDET